MSVQVVRIEGACVEAETLSEFSKSAVMQLMGVTQSALDEAIKQREDGLFTDDNATDVDVKQVNDRTIVTVFDSEGEAYFFIGPTSDWIG